MVISHPFPHRGLIADAYAAPISKEVLCGMPSVRDTHLRLFLVGIVFHCFGVHGSTGDQSEFAGIEKLDL